MGSDDFDFDRTISTIAICDWESFLGDTLKEKYEGVYVKLVEMKNVLRAKAEKSGLETGEFIILAGEFLADLMECSRTYCFGQPPDRSVELPLIGEFHIGGDNTKVFWNKSLPRNKVLVQCDAGKGLLIINNIPQLEEHVYKPTSGA